jgi:hypothetical protein
MGRIRDGHEDGSQAGNTPNSLEDTGDTVCLHFLEIPTPVFLHRTTGELCERAWDVMIEKHKAKD